MNSFRTDLFTLLQRNLMSHEIKVSNLLGEYNLLDADNSISLGIDRAGYLYLSFDHHATLLLYKHSLAPRSIEQSSEDQSMTGRQQNLTRLSPATSCEIKSMIQRVVR